MGSTISAKQVYDYVRERIVTKELFPGNHVIEEDLARAMSTSRATVRSALMRLNYEGFVDIVPNAGAFVARPTLTDISNAFLTRVALEREAVRLAVRNITRETLDRLHASMQLQREMTSNFSMVEYANVNRQFHWEIVRASNNTYMEKYLNELYNKTHLYLIFYDKSQTNVRSLKTHQQLLDALERGDADSAVEAVEQDIEWGASVSGLM